MGSGVPGDLPRPTMRFLLIDKILTVDAKRLTAVKAVTNAEEYLGDHFPTFPVLPGVLMLEALVQASAYLYHHHTHFKHSMTVLREARNFRYGQFVAPGTALDIEAEWVRELHGGALFKASGSIGGQLAVSGRVELACFDLADRDADLASADEQIRQLNRQRYKMLRGGMIDLPVGQSVR